MKRTLHDYRLFWREFRRTFHTTGAVLPSGRPLAKALARPVREGQTSGTRRILEVGPGTGAVTARIIADMRPEDRLEMVELNDQFVARLRERFASEPHFRRVSDRAEIIHKSIEALEGQGTYDIVVSGLPLNNFAAAEVRSILAAFVRLLKPTGSLSFFEYIAVRQARSLISTGNERARLRGISQELQSLFDGRRCQRQWIWPNVPPAWVHHVQMHD